MSNCYDHELKMNMLDTYYFKDKKQTEKMLNENRAKLTNWFLFEMQNIKMQKKILINGLMSIQVKVLMRC